MKNSLLLCLSYVILTAVGCQNNNRPYYPPVNPDPPIVNPTPTPTVIDDLSSIDEDKFNNIVGLDLNTFRAQIGNKNPWRVVIDGNKTFLHYKVRMSGTSTIRDAEITVNNAQIIIDAVIGF
jgi:hypothetical protein